MTYPVLKFIPATFPPDAYSVDAWIAKGLTPDQAKSAVENLKEERVVRSECGTYQVNIKDLPATEHWPAMIHLSIKRVDKQPIGDWRIMQAIKNGVLSPEHEAVELYPAESRLVDTANQYHLYALADPEMRFPFGFTERLVQDVGEGPDIGAVQRPLSE